MIEYSLKIKEEVKPIQSEMKKNTQGTNSEQKETGTQIIDLEQKEELNIQPEQNEETWIQKYEERLRNLWDNFKHPTSKPLRCQKKKRKSKKLKTYLKK